MALIVNGAQVAEGMSDVVEAALQRGSEVFIPSVTYNDNFNVNAVGEVQVELIDPAPVDPSTPGGVFTHENYTNRVVNVPMCNSFRKSVRVSQYTIDSLPTNVLANSAYTVGEDCREGRGRGALAFLCQNGTQVSGDAFTKQTIESIIMAQRATLRKDNYKPDVVILSVDAYSILLEIAGDRYIPYKNEEIIQSGQIGWYKGMLWVESTDLGGTYSYLTADGNEVEVNTSNVEAIVYDHRTFTICDRLNVLDAINAVDWIGVAVRGEIDCGFRLLGKANAVTGKFEGVIVYSKNQ